MADLSTFPEGNKCFPCSRMVTSCGMGRRCNASSPFSFVQERMNIEKRMKVYRQNLGILSLFLLGFRDRSWRAVKLRAKCRRRQSFSVDQVAVGVGGPSVSDEPRIFHFR